MKLLDALWLLLAIVVLAAIAGYGGILTLQYATIFQYVFWIALIAFAITLIIGLMTCRIPKIP